MIELVNLYVVSALVLLTLDREPFTTIMGVFTDENVAENYRDSLLKDRRIHSAYVETCQLNIPLLLVVEPKEN